MKGKDGIIAFGEDKGLLRSKYVCYIKNKKRNRCQITLSIVTALLYTHPVAFLYF